MSAPRLGPFELDSVIAAGGMAEVWRAVHVGTGVPVAVKLMRSDGSQRGAWQSAFRAEVRAMARLHHPGIVRIHDYGTAEGVPNVPSGTPWLAMELVEGGTLAERASRSWSQVQRVLFELLDALAAAHAGGVIHRDLKPANVLVAEDGTVKLTDFGIAHALERGELSGGSTLDGGTPPFMAPEQFEDHLRDTGPWTDLYALGCLAWFLVQGRPPFGRQPDWMRAAIAHTRQPIPPFRPKMAVPDELEGWLHRLLQKAPTERYQRAADAAWALARLGAVASGVSEGSADDPTRATTSPTAHTLPWRPASAELVEMPTLRRPGGAEGAGPGVGRPAQVERPPIPESWREMVPAPPGPLAGVGLGLFGLRSVPLVGRVEERKALWEALRGAARSGRPRMVLLTGVAGTGKSRLAEWLLERSEAVGAAVWSVATHAVPAGSGDGAAAMVRRDLQLAGLSLDEAVERVRHQLLAAGVFDGDEARSVASLALRPVAGAEAGELGWVRFSTPGERHAQVSRHLLRRARGRVAGLWLDDAQWGLEGLQQAGWMLDHARSPLLIVATVREELLDERSGERRALEGLRARPDVIEIAVDILGPRELQELLGLWLGLSSQLAGEVAERTAGNPLFAVQLVGDWVDRDLLRPSPSGAFELAQGALPELPDDLHAMWLARVDRVVTAGPASWRVALELAGALGMDVDRSEWFALCARVGQEAPDGLIDALQRAQLARGQGDRGWRFAHAMLRESVERDARDRGRWVDHNLACVDFLADSGLPGRIGRHLFAADQWLEAADPLLQDATDRLFSTELRNAESSLELADRALELGQAPAGDPRRAVVLLGRSRVLLDRGEAEGAHRLAQEALAISRSRGWREQEAQALLRIGEVLRDRPDVPGARVAFAESLAIYESLHDRLGIGTALHELGRVAIFSGDYERAMELNERARQQYLADGDPNISGIANCLRAAGELEVRRGVDLDGARRLFSEAAERYRRLGIRYGEAACANGQAEVARMQGDLEAAEAGYRRSIQLAEAMGRDADVMRINLAIVQLERGDAAAAEPELAAVTERMIGAERWGLVGFVDVLRLECLALLGQWESWPAHLERADAALRQSRLVDRDTARFAERAGDRAERSGREALAQGAWRLALWQWEAVGEEERAAVLRARLS